VPNIFTTQSVWHNGRATVFFLALMLAGCASDSQTSTSTVFSAAASDIAGNKVAAFLLAYDGPGYITRPNAPDDQRIRLRVPISAPFGQRIGQRIAETSGYPSSPRSRYGFRVLLLDQYGAPIDEIELEGNQLGFPVGRTARYRGVTYKINGALGRLVDELLRHEIPPPPRTGSGVPPSGSGLPPAGH
jgi:hypothetical protein